MTEKEKAIYKKYGEKNKDKIKKAQKIYREKNKDKIKKVQKIYQENNREKILEKRRIYRENNREKINAIALKNYHKMRKMKKEQYEQGKIDNEKYLCLYEREKRGTAKKPKLTYMQLKARVHLLANRLYYAKIKEEKLKNKIKIFEKLAQMRRNND